MKIRSSLRRIGNALVVTGVLSLSVVTLSQITAQCSTAQVGCLAAAVSFSAPDPVMPAGQLTGETSVSTAARAENTPSMATFVVEFVQVTSIYLILLGVTLLVLLELRELHYLRRLVRKAKHS